ncbi:MAG: ribonuclease domain-containing protein [Isosphaeraceae bacterium]|nr:ribonuclease domain-containing protein [Isosphaeraceae bacterium]
MGMRDRVIWGEGNPFSDPRLVGLDELVKNLRQGRIPPGVTGGSIFANHDLTLPMKIHGHYREYDVVPTVKGVDRGKLRLVLGAGGEVYITGDHYGKFRRVLGL